MNDLGNDVWDVQREVRLPGGVRLPARMTVARLPGGELWVHSPVSIDDALAEQLDALGDVAYLVAPNLFHHLHIGEASKRYPRAIVHAPPGLSKKRPDLRIDRLFGVDEPAWSDAVDAVTLGGAPMVSETVFLHRASGTLVVTDLFFNIREPQGFATKMLMWAAGAHGKFARGREWWFLTRDRSALDRDLQQMMDWNFRRVVPAHGEVQEGDARQLTADALNIRVSLQR